jgi:hypothetical protein
VPSHTSIVVPSAARTVLSRVLASLASLQSEGGGGGGGGEEEGGVEGG